MAASINRVGLIFPPNTSAFLIMLAKVFPQDPSEAPPTIATPFSGAIVAGTTRAPQERSCGVGHAPVFTCPETLARKVPPPDEWSYMACAGARAQCVIGAGAAADAVATVAEVSVTCKQASKRRSKSLRLISLSERSFCTLCLPTESCGGGESIRRRASGFCERFVAKCIH